MATRTMNSFRPSLLILLLLMITLTPVAGLAQSSCGEVMETTLMAGQNIPVGTVTIENDEQYLYVTYQTDGNWLITETHLDVATQPVDLKQTSKGNAIAGQFAYKSDHDPGVITVTHTIDLSAWPSNSNLYLAAHCVVVSGSESETAWAEGMEFPGKNWAMYVAYTMQSCEPSPIAPGVINMQAERIEVMEDAVSITLQLTRNEGSDGVVTVTLETQDLTAIKGEDYSSDRGLQATFEDGETDKSITVYILDDSIDEYDEDFDVQIITVTGGAELGPNDSTLIIIKDNDDPLPS